MQCVKNIFRLTPPDQKTFISPLYRIAHQKPISVSMKTTLHLAYLLFCVPCLLVSTALAGTTDRGAMVSRDITPEDIAVFGSWKANLVRYPLEWLQGAGEADSAAYDEWLEGALQQLDQRIPLFRAAGIRVVINLYSPPGGFQREKVCTSSHRIFCETWAQQQFMTTWEKIAARYRDEKTIYGYDLVNEPGFRAAAPGLMNWNKLALQTVKRIRAIDSRHLIIVEPPYGDVGRLKQLNRIPYSNVVYSIHFYFPLEFQHQGINGRRMGVSYPTKKLNKKSLEKQVATIKAFQKKVKGKIYVGEFSAVRWAPKNSSYLYLRDLISLFEKNGWNWTYHAFREADPWSLEHDGNISNKTPTTRETDRARLLKAYFKKNRRR